MSINIMNMVWNSNVETNRKFILLCYANYCNDEGENTWPAVGTISKMTSLSERTVQRVTRQMIKEGILREDGKSKKGTNRYKINVEYFTGDTVTPIKDKTPGVTLTTTRGDTDDAMGDTDDARGDTVWHPNLLINPLINLEINHRIKPLTNDETKNVSSCEDVFSGEKEDNLNSEEYRKRLGNALLNGIQKHVENPQNDLFQGYPEDVADWCREFSRVSNCEPTPFQKSDWIKGARNCLMAGIAKDRIKDVIDQMDRENAKYYRPGSIVLIGQKLVRGNNINLGLRNSK